MVDPQIPTVLCGDFNAVFHCSLDQRGSDVLDVSHESFRALVACVAVVSVSLKPSGASVQGHWANRSKKVGTGGGAGKERKRLPLSPNILPDAVRQRTGGSDALSLANCLSIKLIDQNDIRITVYQS